MWFLYFILFLIVVALILGLFIRFAPITSANARWAKIIGWIKVIGTIKK